MSRLDGFIKISRYAGMREDIVQSVGGNSSYKISNNKMVIKASGYQLADISNNNGFAIVNHKIISDYFMNNEVEDITEANGKTVLTKAFIEGEKPSIETFLHSVTGKYTLHTHPIVVNALTCRKSGEKIIKKLFPKALVVPYATPGIELAKAYFKAYKKQDKNTDISTIFLMNHGLVVSGENADLVINRTENILNKIESFLCCDYSSYHEATSIWKFFTDKIVWKVTDKNIIDIYNSEVVWNHCFCPDCVVFLGKKLLILPKKYKETDILKFIKSFGSPIMLSHNGQLYLVADNVRKAMETQSVMSFSLQVMLLNKGTECIYLSEEEQNYLLNWDAEKYRKKIK